MASPHSALRHKIREARDAGRISPLAARLYEALLLVRPGTIITYKTLAEHLGIKGYRAVGQILSRNPFAPDVPCHRVIRSDGTIGGFDGARARVGRKRELLAREGVRFVEDRLADRRKLRDSID